MMGPGFFAAAFANDIVKIAIYAFVVGFMVGATVIVGVVFVVH